MRTLLLPITLLATACEVDPELGTLTEAEAAAAYSTMKTRLREADALVLNNDRPPQMYEYGCASGMIDLRISLDAEMQPRVLEHAFETCELDSLTFDGTIFYRDIDACDDAGGMAMSVFGRIDLQGSMDGFCYIQTRDNCGKRTGHICGFPAATLDITSDVPD